MGRTVKSQTENSTALLFGLGYTAKALIPVLQARGIRVIATVRTADKAKNMAKLTGAEVLPFAGHLTDPLRKAIRSAHMIISSAPPADDGSDPILSAIPALTSRAQNCRWAGYLSATSVYGDRGGDWAFEDELLYPATERGKNRVQTELAWLESGLPVHVFRLAGIYGPEIFGQSRNAFDRLRMGRAKAVIKPGHVVNRIHVEDIASALLASMEAPNPCQVYNIADGRPAPPEQVLEFAADLIGEPRAPQVDLASADLSPMARSFYAETKRIDISRARSELGWQPKYATYKDGLCEIYRNSFGPETFVLAGHIMVPEADLPAIRRELPAHRDATLAEPGCLRFDVYPDVTDKLKYYVFEAFKSEQAFRDHKKRMAGTDWSKASARVERFYTVGKSR